MTTNQGLYLIKSAVRAGLFNDLVHLDRVFLDSSHRLRLSSLIFSSTHGILSASVFWYLVDLYCFCTLFFVIRSHHASRYV